MISSHIKEKQSMNCLKSLKERLFGHKLLRQKDQEKLCVVCFSFTISNVFKKKKGIIKILVYSSVIDINQMEVTSATIITGS